MLAQEMVVRVLARELKVRGKAVASIKSSQTREMTAQGKEGRESPWCRYHGMRTPKLAFGVS